MSSTSCYGDVTSLSPAAAGRTAAASRVTIAALLIGVLAGCGGLRLPYPLRDQEADIRTFNGNTLRNNDRQPISDPPLFLEWEQNLTAGFGEGAPLLVDSVLFLGNLRGELYAFDARTGKRYGWVGLGGAIHGAPVIDGNLAIVPLVGSRESLVAYDLLEGKTRWRQMLGDIHVSPLLLESRIFIANTAGTFYCVSREDGGELWRFDLPDNTTMKGIRSSPAGFDQSVLFGADDGFLYHLVASSGTLRWRFDAGAAVYAPAVIHQGDLFVGTLEGKILAIAMTTGTALWSYDAGGSIYGSALVDSALVIVGTTAGRVVAINRATGLLVWETDVRAPINSGIVGSGQYVYAGTLRKDLLALQRKTGEVVWRGTTGGRIKTTPIIGVGRIFVAGDNRILQAFREGKK